MKKILFIFPLFLSSLLFSSSFSFSAETVGTSVTLSWDNFEGASSYRVYINNTEVYRANNTTFSYTATRLINDTEMLFCVVAYDVFNTKIAESEKAVVTGNWEGVYKWENKTNKSNGGKMREYTLMFEKNTSSYNVYLLENDQKYLISPLPETAKNWVNYKDNTPLAISYRVNAEKFNTTLFNPSRWRLISNEYGYNYIKSEILSEALGIKVRNELTFYMFTEGGKRKVLFYMTSSSSLMDSFLFKNPNPGEGKYIILEEI